MPNATRRQGREWAVQMLFQADLNPGADVDTMISTFWNQQWTCRMEAGDGEKPSRRQKRRAVPDRVAPPGIRLFAEERVRGVLSRLGELDGTLRKYAENWAMHRIGTVERSVLRLACYELLHCPDVPAPVVLNEAVDLAKYFSCSEAGRFVNGILDRISRDVRKEQSTCHQT